MNVLIKFWHGLGDAAQFTSVLRHIARHRPDWSVDVWAKNGKHSCFHGLCHASYHEHQPRPPESDYQLVKDLGWWENYSVHEGYASTKIHNCLREEFEITPDLDLLSYQINVRPEIQQKTRAYLQEICTAAGVPSPLTYPVVAIHYEGNTSSEKKNLHHSDADAICRWAIDHGRVPLILDWDFRTPLVDNRRVFCPDRDNPLWGQIGTGDGETLAALIGWCELFIGVDSGPLHVAGATSTPTLAVWTYHHPTQFYDLCPNTLHLVPDYHETLGMQHQERLRRVFREQYRSVVYRTGKKDPGERVQCIIDQAAKILGVPQPRYVDVGGWLVREGAVNQDFTVIHAVDTQDEYQLALNGQLREGEPIVVDVGAHIGAFARRMLRHNPRARLFLIEAAPENIPLLRHNAGPQATVIHAAVTYLPGDVRLKNSCLDSGESTGGSIVIPSDQVTTEADFEAGRYWDDRRPLPKLTLEELLARYDLPRIDLLKIDCEGCEWDVLEHCTCLDRIGYIYGEAHCTGGLTQFHALRERRFADWSWSIQGGDDRFAIFHLHQVGWPPSAVV